MVASVDPAVPMLPKCAHIQSSKKDLLTLAAYFDGLAIVADNHAVTLEPRASPVGHREEDFILVGADS